MILPFTEELEGAQNDTLFERLMLDVLEDSLGGTSAVFAEPGIGKSVASVLAAQKTNASQSRLTVVLQGAFEESLETFFRVQKASQAPKVARSMFKMLADHGVRLQIVFDNTFDNEVPEQSKAPMRDLTRFAFAHGHHLIVICQAREGAESVDDLNGVRTRIAAQQNGRCAEEFRWSEKLAENYLNATVMSELKARGHGLERYADVMREWLNGTKVRDQFGGWNPTIMSLYVRRMCTLGEDVPREARAAPRGESTSAVWARQLQKHSADVKNGRQVDTCFPYFTSSGQVTRPSSRGSQSPSKMSRLIRLTSTESTYKKRGAPDCFFCWLLPGFRFWQAGAWQRIKDESKDLRQDTTRPSVP